MRLYGPLNDFLKGLGFEAPRRARPYGRRRDQDVVRRGPRRAVERKDDHHAIEFRSDGGLAEELGRRYSRGTRCTRGRAGDPTPAREQPRPRAPAPPATTGQTPVGRAAGAPSSRARRLPCGWWTRPRRGALARCASQRLRLSEVLTSASRQLGAGAASGPPQPGGARRAIDARNYQEREA